MPKGRTESARIAPGEYQHSHTSIAELRSTFLGWIHKEAPQALEDLRELDGSSEAFDEWSRRWYLASDWLLDVARRSWITWQVNSIARRNLEWGQVEVRGEIVPELPASEWRPHPLTLEWQPTLETEAQFCSRVDKYIDTIRGLAKASGFVEVPTKPNLARDMAALVQFQVAGDDFGIVVTRHLGREGGDAARKALIGLCKDLGITLKPRK